MNAFCTLLLLLLLALLCAWRSTHSPLKPYQFKCSAHTYSRDMSHCNLISCRNKHARFGTASPSKNACLGYIDHFAELYGQLMPHENATYLYLGSMKVRPGLSCCLKNDRKAPRPLTIPRLYVFTSKTVLTAIQYHLLFLTLEGKETYFQCYKLDCCCFLHINR